MRYLTLYIFKCVFKSSCLLFLLKKFLPTYKQQVYICTEQMQKCGKFVTMLLNHYSI